MPEEITPAPTGSVTPEASTGTAPVVVAPVVPDPTGGTTPPAGDPPAQTGAWGDDWRQKIAKDDAKLLKQLERFTSPEAFAQSWAEKQRLIDSGQVKKALGADATPEQIAQYRKDNGIPETAEGYFEKLPDGLVIGEADKPLFDSFAKGLHDLNVDPKVAQYAVKWYSDLQREAEANIAEGDRAHKTEVEDALRAEWGADYRANVNVMQAVLKSAPAGVAEMLQSARGADGRAVLNDPNVLRWLANVGRELNPVATLMPGAGTNAGNSIAEEIGNIEKLMANPSSEYWKGPTSERMQSRYRELIDARERLKARAA